MSDFPQGADWWKADDGHWYPPDAPKSETPAGEEPPPPPEPDGGWSTAAGQAKTSGDDNNAKVGCGVIIAAVIVLSVLFSMCGSDDDGTGADDIQFGAFDVCTQFVKDRLKSPGTASFRNYFQDDGEVSVSGAGDGPFTVRSSVDSENGFGAILRTDFTCTVQHTGDGNYRLVSLNVDE